MKVTAIEVKQFLFEWLKRRIKEQGLSAEGLSETSDLFASGLLDSMGVIEMISAVEERFGLSVDFEAISPEEIGVISSFSAYVEKQAEKR